MDQANREVHTVADWDFAPADRPQMYAMRLTPATAAEPREYELTHDQALLLALRIAHQLR